MASMMFRGSDDGRIPKDAPVKYSSWAPPYVFIFLALDQLQLSISGSNQIHILTSSQTGGTNIVVRAVVDASGVIEHHQERN